MYADPRFVSVYLSLVFGAFYIPFQILFHLPHIVTSSKGGPGVADLNLNLKQVKKGCWKAFAVRKVSTLYEHWGGIVGAIWMSFYWLVLPLWTLYIASRYDKLRYY